MLIIHIPLGKSMGRYDIVTIYVKGPIFSKAISKSRWLLEHENLFKVGKYIAKISDSFHILQIYCIFWQEISGNVAKKMGLCAVYFLKQLWKK